MEDELRDNHLAFIGKILSTVTHEFQNHLAIIKESAGLMGDILSIDSSVDPAKRERYQKIINSIEARVAKASGMTQQLNYFGHRLDLPIAQFDMNELLSEELRLLERLAAQKQLALSMDLDKSLPPINSYPGLCQFIFYKIIDFVFGLGTAHSTITIKTSSVRNGILVAVAVTGLKDAGNDLFESVNKQCNVALEKISGQIDFDQHKEEVTLQLTS